MQQVHNFKKNATWFSTNTNALRIIAHNRDFPVYPIAFSHYGIDKNAD